MSSGSRKISRPWIVRSVVLVLVISLLVPAAVSAVTHEPTNLRSGTITEPAEGTTVISVQGFHFQGNANRKKPARLVAVGPRGDVEWVHNGSTVDAVWFYDVDLLDNGNLLVTATQPEKTLVYELDSNTQEIVWLERFNLTDTHDADLINGDELLIADKENHRVLVYDRTKGEFVWEWKFADYYDKNMGGKAEDWTHFNDIDKIGDGRYLLSPRNFDQAIVVDRETGDITMRLGSDDDHETLHEQHNPDYLENRDGSPTLLVADSENDRIVEYTKAEGGEGTSNTSADEWTRTWKLGDGKLNWPRDADRLPNGNTLVTDSLNHRVIEVTPQGDIVWEFYAPWATYDAVRIPTGENNSGPTMRDHGTTGSYSLSGSAGLEPGTGETATFSTWLVGTFADSPVEGQVRWFAERWGHVTPWIRPVWMDGWDFVGVVAASLLVLVWLVAELVYQRGRIRRRFPSSRSG